jgi:hypothetical protein
MKAMNDHTRNPMAGSMSAKTAGRRRHGVLGALLLAALMSAPGWIMSASRTVDGGPHPVMLQAQRWTDELASRGRVSVPVRLQAGSGFGSSGGADFDFVSGTCVVRIDPESAERIYGDADALRFFVYHELSHCELYRHPGGFFRQPELSGAAARLLDDFVLLDALDADQPEERVNLFVLAHETYADLRASALLLEAGVDRAVVDRIAAMRRAASFDRSHATEQALDRLMDMRAAELSGTHLESTVRMLTGEHLLVAAIVPTYRPTARFALEFRPLLENRIGSVQGRLAAGQGHWSAYLGNAEAPQARLDVYPHLAWAFAHRTEAAAQARAEFVHAWLDAIYGPMDALAEADALGLRIIALADRLGAEGRR